jgi:WD40 repeat protein
MGRREQSWALLSEAARLRPTSQVRDEAIIGMALFDLPVTGFGPEFSSDHWQIDFDGNLERYAESTRAGLIIVSRVVDQVEICRIPELIPTAMLMLSPDGHYLAARSGAGQSLSVWSLDGDVPQVVHRELCHGDYGIGAFSFSRDSRLFALGRPDGTVSVGSLSPGQLAREWKFDAGAQHLAFRPHRPQIAVASRDCVQIRDYETGRLLVRLEETAGTTWVAWHPDGKLLATADADLGISLWEPDEFRRFRKLRGHENHGIQLGFNASGTMLASEGWDGVLRFWDPFDGSLLFSSRTAGVSALRSAVERSVWAGTNDAGGRIRFWQTDDHEVYGRLTSGSVTSAERYIDLAVSPQGIARHRLLAAATPQGVRFWDLGARRPIGLLPVPAVGRVCFDGAGTLWTNSPAGIERWPIEESVDERGTLVVGPAVGVLPTGTNGDLDVTPDGRTVAFAGTAGAFVWHADRPDGRQDLQGHRDPRYVSVSPDGRWIATGSHLDTQVKIWDGRTGTLVRELDLSGSRVAFSPDGAWLATTSGGFSLWSVGDWNRAWQGVGDYSSTQAFSPDGRVVAVGARAGLIVLYETASRREVARLADPNGVSPSWLKFSPDLRYLAGISHDFKNLFVWDLHEIDRRLKEMGIAWDWPSARAAPSDEPEMIPLKIAARVDSRSDASAQPFHACPESDDYAKAIADALTALAAIGAHDPREAHYCNQLAWYYVMAPVELRRPDEALALVRRAVRHEPNRAAYLNTLGVALCRRGQWDESIDALRRSLHMGSVAPAGDLYFLALCYHHLHDARLATESFEQAVHWHDIHEGRLDGQTRCELAAMRNEVEAVLKLSRDHRQNAEFEPTAPP